MKHVSVWLWWLFQWVLCIVHGTYKPLFSTKLSLKMDPIALFTHLKIILLQYFQFSAISSIQTNPKYPSLIVCNIELHLLFESRKWWIKNIITYQSDYSSSPINIFQSYSSIESLWYILLLSIVIFLMNFFFCVYKLDSIGAQINFKF